MREILYRGKAINRPSPEYQNLYRTNYNNGDWVYGIVSDPYYYEAIKRYMPHGVMTMTNTDCVADIEVDRDTIGEYTGLEDMNGNKIFEGDIVKYPNIIETLGTDKFEVVFAYGCFYVAHKGLIRTLKSFNESIEIIGNIYDNPELAKELR